MFDKPIDPTNVEVEILDEHGNVVDKETLPLKRVSDHMAFVMETEAAYCLISDGYFCCDKESRTRLSKESLEVCRKLAEKM